MSDLLYYLTAPFSVSSQYYLLHKDKAVKAFKKVFGREPSDREVELVINGYLYNRSQLGDLLKNKQYVLEIQKAINKVIYPSKIKEDGIFYYETEAGLLKFQIAKGLKPTGRLDEDTIYALVGANNSPLLRRLSSIVSSNKETKLLLLGIAGGLAFFLLLKKVAGG